MTDKHTLVDEYLIRKGGYFYRPKSQGYTSSPLEAGVYTLKQAIRETHPNGPDGPRDGLTYHHRSDFPEIVEATNMATRITALEAEKAELVRDRDALMMFAQSIQTWCEDADSYDRECGHEPRTYCEDVELMAASASNTLRRIRARATLAKARQSDEGE